MAPEQPRAGGHRVSTTSSATGPSATRPRRRVGLGDLLRACPGATPSGCGRALQETSTRRAGEAGPMSRHLRVVQWTTGKTGSAAVRGMVGHPVLDLVGCYAYSADKVGRDVGELCGIEPIGITATDDVEALLALEPDCVVVHGLPAELRPPRAHPRVGRQRRRHHVHARRATATARSRPGGCARRACGAARPCTPAASTRATRRWWPWRPARCAAASTASRCSSRSTSRATPTSRCSGPRASTSTPTTPTAAQACEASCGSFKDQIPVMAKALGVEHRRRRLPGRVRHRRRTTPTSGS